jgi:hypothetical protein
MEKTKPMFVKPVELVAEGVGSRTKIYEGLATGKIPYVVINGLKRIPRAWLEQQVARAMAGISEPDADEER